MSPLEQLLMHGVCRGINPVDLGFSLMSMAQTMFSKREINFGGDLGELERDFVDTAADVLEGVLESLNYVNLQAETVIELARQIGLSDNEVKLAVMEGTTASLAGYVDALQDEPEIESALTTFNGHLAQLVDALRIAVADADGGAA